MSIYEQLISADANRQGGYDSFSAPLSASPGTREMHDVSIVAEWLDSLPRADICSAGDDDEFSLKPVAVIGIDAGKGSDHTVTSVVDEQSGEASSHAESL